MAKWQIDNTAGLTQCGEYKFNDKPNQQSSTIFQAFPNEDKDLFWISWKTKFKSIQT